MGVGGFIIGRYFQCPSVFGLVVEVHEISIHGLIA